MHNFGLSGLDVLQEVGQGHVGHPKGSGGASESILDFACLEVFGERCKVPLEMLDVSVESDGGIRDDFVLVEASRASLGNSGFGDPRSEHDLLSSSIFVFSALDGGRERSRGVDQVSIRVEVENGFLLVADFHVAQVDGVGPALRVQSAQAGGVQNTIEDSMTFADVEAIVVLAIHKIGVIDLKGELLEVVCQSENVKLRLREKGDILVDQGERVETK